MSRGPGRLQRRVIDVLAAHPHLPEMRTTEIAYALSDEWWWDETFDRQVRRALDGLHRVGLVSKRVVPNEEIKRGSISFWSLTQPV